nr:hypothetical protein MFMH1_41220 [Myxococcus sp. MH1]
MQRLGVKLKQEEKKALDARMRRGSANFYLLRLRAPPAN